MSEISKGPFEDQAERFLSFWRESMADLPPVGNGKPCGFLITPWLSTPVPWFSITLAMIYALRGKRPVLIFNDVILPHTEPESQLPVVEEVLAEVAKLFEVVKLSGLETSSFEDGMEDVAENCSRLYAEVFLRKIEPADDLKEKKGQVLSTARDVAGRVATLFTKRPFDHFVIPGGLYGASPIYLALGQKAGVRVASYDCGVGTLVVGTDDVAGHCLDVARAFEPQYETLRGDHAREIEFAAKREFLARVSARDRYGYQNFAMDEQAPVPEIDVLMPLNIFDDAAGISRVQCFETPRDWVMETVERLLRRPQVGFKKMVGRLFRRPGIKVTVREHPAAAKVLTNRSLCEEMQERFGDDPGFTLVRADDPVSTYALLGASKIVLPCSSTVGIEAAALGKRVILESKVYYGGLGFAELKATRDEYFEAIERHLDNYSPLPPDLQRTAWECYFFSQLASFLDGSFTPQPPDFDVWVARDLRELEESVQVSMFAEAFIENRPSCIVQVPQVLAEASAAYSESELEKMNSRLRHLSPTFAS